MSLIQQVLSTQSAVTNASPELASLKKSTTGMESAFLKQIVSMMRKSAGDVHFGESLGGEMYQDMFDQNIADTLAEKNTMGVGKAMYDSMARQVLNQNISRHTAASIAATKD